MSGSRDSNSHSNFVHYAADAIPWRASSLQQGAQMAVLAGDLTAPGLYIQRVKYPAGAITPAHYHPDDRHVVVLTGTWHAGFGDKADPAKARAFKPGDYLMQPAGAVHFDGALDEDCIVQITGYGPTGITIVEKRDA
jgi:quercetin dioxygenase-like cupin family protein